MEFYISMDCEHCDEEVFYGLCITTIEHKGRPVIPFDMAAQTAFVCKGCGQTSYTGDFEVFTEEWLRGCRGDRGIQALKAEYDRRGAALSDYSESMGEYDRMAAEQRELRIIHEIVCAELSVARRRIDDLSAELAEANLLIAGLASAELHRHLRLRSPEGY